MDITFVPYAGASCAASVRVAKNIVASELADLGIVRFPLAISAHGTGSSRVTGSFTAAATRIVSSDGATVAILNTEKTSILATTDSVVPAIDAGYVSSEATTITAHCIQVSRDSATVNSAASVVSFGTESHAGINGDGAIIRLSHSIFAYERRTYTNFAAMYPAMAMRIVQSADPVLLINEQFGLSETYDAQRIMTRFAQLGLNGESKGLLDAFNEGMESLTLGEVILVLWRLLHSEAMSLGDAHHMGVSNIVAVAEALALVTGAGSALDAMNVVVQALLLGESRGYVWPAAVLEQLAAGETAFAALLGLSRYNENLDLSDGHAGYVSISALAHESMALAEGSNTTAEFVQFIREGIDLLLRISLPDGDYLAWVCNTASRGFSMYRNFPFNSFAELDGQYYGATDTGIYLLEGDDDDGTPITARLRSGLMEMGGGKLARMDGMYLGYRAAGDLVLKVITTSDRGEKAETWYRIQERPSEAVRDGRVKIGKGLKSRYWGFELINADGKDFELDNISFHPIVLERKV